MNYILFNRKTGTYLNTDSGTISWVSEKDQASVYNEEDSTRLVEDNLDISWTRYRVDRPLSKEGPKPNQVLYKVYNQLNGEKFYHKNLVPALPTEDNYLFSRQEAIDYLQTFERHVSGTKYELILEPQIPQQNEYKTRYIGFWNTSNDFLTKDINDWLSDSTNKGVEIIETNYQVVIHDYTLKHHALIRYRKPINK